IWELITVEQSRKSVEVSERFADGMATSKELERAFISADRIHDASGGGLGHLDALDAARLSAHPLVRGLADSTALAAAMALARANVGGDLWSKYNKEKAGQCPLLRDIFGNPFRSPTFEPAWRTPTALSVAQAMYDSRDFSAIPALGCLREAGCTDAGI